MVKLALRARHGASSLGCLTTLLIIVAIAYFGIPIGEKYLSYYRFEDAMKQEVRFAEARDDQSIRTRLQNRADSLGLPEEALKIKINRSPKRIKVWTNYYEHFELPGYVREVHFNPSAERRF